MRQTSSVSHRGQFMWVQDSALGSDPGESISVLVVWGEEKYCLYLEFLEVELYCNSHSATSWLFYSCQKILKYFGSDIYIPLFKDVAIMSSFIQVFSKCRIFFSSRLLVSYVADKYLMLFPNAKHSLTPFSFFPFCLTASLIILWGLSLLWLWSEERRIRQTVFGCCRKTLRCLISLVLWVAWA